MNDEVGVCSGDGEHLLDDNVSIIRLLRVFLGATVGDDEGSTTPPAPSSGPSSSSSSSSSRAAAREHAGCTLWDMSADEGHASVMCAAGLAAVSCKVLRDCADAKARATDGQARDACAESPESKEPELGATAVAVAGAAAAGGQDTERLREVTSGLLANICSHRGLRQHVAGSPSLGEELLCTFHDSDDPAPLTELLRLFSAVALTTTTVNANDGNSAAVVAAAQGNDDEEPRGSEESMTPARAGGVVKAAPEAAVAGPVGLTLRLAEKETLERLAFFLENSLEERLLAWACSLTYSLMYRHGDAVIRPLVEVYRVEESLAALLNSRSTDLAYEKLGGTETGFDVLLRCLEVLSTSEASSLGPSAPPVMTVPTRTHGPAAGGAETTAAAAGAGKTGGTSEVRDSAQQQQQKKRKVLGEGEKERQGGEEGDVVARRNGEATAPPPTTTTTTLPAFRRRERRGGVVKGLVAALVPWEHSRRIQRAALLVLGNVLGAALGEDSDNFSRCLNHEEGGGKAGRAAGSCAVEVGKGLSTWDAREEEEEWGGGGKEEGGGDATGGERLATTRRKHFQDAVNHLLGEEEDGLGEELQEAAENVKNVLEKLPEEPQPTNTTAVVGVSS